MIKEFTTSILSKMVRMNVLTDALNSSFSRFSALFKKLLLREFQTNRLVVHKLPDTVAACLISTANPT